MDKISALLENIIFLLFTLFFSHNRITNLKTDRFWFSLCFVCASKLEVVCVSPRTVSWKLSLFDNFLDISVTVMWHQSEWNVKFCESISPPSSELTNLILLKLSSLWFFRDTNERVRHAARRKWDNFLSWLTHNLKIRSILLVDIWRDDFTLHTQFPTLTTRMEVVRLLAQ